MTFNLFRDVYGELAIRTVDLLSSYPDVTGLYDRVVHDVLDDSKAFGLVTVPARQYNVDCSHEISDIAVWEASDDGDFVFVNITLNGSGMYSGFAVVSVLGSTNFKLFHFHCYLHHFLQVNNALNLRQFYAKSGTPGDFASVIITPNKIIDAKGTSAARLVLDRPFTCEYYHHTRDCRF